MPKIVSLALGFAGLVAFGAAALADTTDVTWQKRILVPKAGVHCRDDANCFNRYHSAIEPVSRADPGDVITFETRDALDSDLALDSTADDVTAIDLNLVHPMTGPVYINGALRGDVLAVTLIDIEPDQYGYTVIVPGFGFLRDLFTEPHVVNWRLSRLGAVSEQMPGIRVPFAPFMGSVGVLPGEPEVDKWLAREGALAEAGGVALMPQPIGAQPDAVCGPQSSHKGKCLRTIPPRENGGNMDVKQMQIGTTLLLPCFVEGCGLFVGDVHFAQGDGEVSGTAVEMGAKVTVTTEILRGKGKDITSPHFEGGQELKALAPGEFYATLGFPLKAKGMIPPYVSYLDSRKITDLENLNEDLTLAARNALIEMIDYLVREKGLTREQAYILCSVAVDLRIGQVVDVPNYTVSAILPLTVFEGR
ncbi:MAG: acetamidase/formamidase family protein [Rhodospirillales bacterium]|nr:acetamidase/formamidase family protein [Rhodospirillales bacterium]